MSLAGGGGDPAVGAAEQAAPGPALPGAIRAGAISPGLFGMLVTTVAVGLLLYLIGWFAPVLAPVGLGLFLTALAAPVFGWLQGRGRSAGAAMTITVGIVVIVGIALVLLAVLSARSLSDSLDAYAAQLNARYPDLAASIASIGLPEPVSAVLRPQVLVDLLASSVAVVLSVAANLVIAVVIAALLLLDSPRLSRLQQSGVGSTNAVLREAPALGRSAITYFVVRIRINALTALGLFVLMVVVGVDDALLWAVGAFFLSFVPYIGLTLALIPPTILAFAELGLGAAAIIVVGGIVLNLIAENVLEPTLTGRALALPTWLVFVMFFLWVWLLGPVGALLSMPISVLIVLVLRGNERTRWMASLLSRQ